MNLLTDDEILSKDCLDLTYDAFDNADIIPRTILEFARAIEAAVLAKFEVVAYLYFDEAGNECFGHPDEYRPGNAAQLYALKGKP
jgi:hypothetical protein